MMFSRFSRVMCSVLTVPMCDVRVMGRFLVISAFVMLGGLAMMFGRVFVMFCGVSVVLCAFVWHLVTFQ